MNVSSFWSARHFEFSVKAIQSLQMPRVYMIYFPIVLNAERQPEMIVCLCKNVLTLNFNFMTMVLARMC